MMSCCGIRTLEVAQGEDVCPQSTVAGSHNIEVLNPGDVGDDFIEFGITNG
jgi:hypothetical protein